MEVPEYLQVFVNELSLQYSSINTPLFNFRQKKQGICCRLSPLCADIDSWIQISSMTFAKSCHFWELSSEIFHQIMFHAFKPFFIAFTCSSWKTYITRHGLKKWRFFHHLHHLHITNMSQPERTEFARCEQTQKSSKLYSTSFKLVCWHLWTWGGANCLPHVFLRIT